MNQAIQSVMQDAAGLAAPVVIAALVIAALTLFAIRKVRSPEARGLAGGAATLALLGFAAFYYTHF